MSLGLIRAALMNVAAASGLVSFASFAWQTYKDVRIQQVAFEQRWQESEIYGIVFEHTATGARFEDIHAKLNERLAALRQPLGLSVEQATTESVRAALMTLTERGVIILRDDFTYAVPMAPAERAPEPPPEPAPAPEATRTDAGDAQREPTSA